MKSVTIPSTKDCPRFFPLIAWLDRLDVLLGEVKPIEQQKQRFGNRAFKTWHAKMLEISIKHLKGMVPEAVQGSMIELLVYVSDSFGSVVRIDYGTGHELAFTTFLFCLRELGLYSESDYRSLVHKVFYRYIALMRKLQLLYKLEPAGS